MKKNIIAGLDVGTTKTVALIAERLDDGKINILGLGRALSEGMLRGTVANVGKTSESIREAVNIAENQSGIKIHSVNIGVAGIHIRSMQHRNYVTINNPDREVTIQDLERLYNDIRLTRIPADYEILHILPEEFFVDDQPPSKTPIGLAGAKLEAATHIVLAQTTALQNLSKSVERANLKILNKILQPIASSGAVLDENEKDIGIAMIDIGGGTTDIAVYFNNSIRYTNVMGIAGSHITNDLRSAFNIVTHEAEKLKIDYGFATPKSIITDKEIYVQLSGVRAPIKIAQSVLAQVIYLRMKELFMLVDHDLTASKLKDKIKCGIVITGGGSLIKGCIELAQEIFGLPCRIGMPLDLGGGLAQKIESPIYSTAVGLLRGGVDLTQPERNSGYSTTKHKTNRTINVFGKIKKFFDEL